MFCDMARRFTLNAVDSRIGPRLSDANRGAERFLHSTKVDWRRCVACTIVSQECKLNSQGRVGALEQRNYALKQRNYGGSWIAKVGEESDRVGTATDFSNDSSSKARGVGFGAPKAPAEKKKPSSTSSSSVRRPAPAKPLIGVQTDEQTQQFETAAVGALVFLFSGILLEGIVLAASGFLPEEWDEFAVNVVYPLFTPSVGVFLAGAAAYGVWKYFGGGGPVAK